MDPFIGGSLISAGSSLLGGLFGKQKKESAHQATRGGIRGQAEGARIYGEEFGFNPLTLLGVSSALPGHAGENSMGSAIANAGMLFADGLARSHEAKQVSALERQNQALQKQVEQMTLKPKVGGIYARQEETPTLLSALGKGSVHVVPAKAVETVSSTASASVPSGADDRPLMDTDRGSVISDGRRGVDNDPVKTHSGYITIDNPALPFPVRVPTLDGDEAVQWYDLPSLAIPAVVGAYDFFDGPAFGPKEGYTSDGEYIGKRPPLKSWQGPRYQSPKKPKSKHPLGSLGF